MSTIPEGRAYLNEWAGKRHVSGRHAPAEDPHCTGSASRHDLDAPTQLMQGRVVDAHPYAGCYKVQFERGGPTLPCVLAGGTSFLPMGASASTTLVVGSTVWAIRHPQTAHGVILAVEPSPGVDPTLSSSDFVHGASRTTPQVEGRHAAILQLPGAGGFVDWSAGRPFDATGAGEWGAMAETGVRVHVDPAMAMLAADEATGFFAFYCDQTARVSGVNLQERSAAHEAEALDDQGEALVYRGATPYPWEHRGVIDPAKDPFRDLTALQAQVTEAHYAAVEPLKDDQQPFHRRLELGGYLGQGGRRMVLLPPKPADLPDGVNRYSIPGTGGAAFEEQVTLDGRYLLRAAKGFSLEKAIAIPAPKRRVRPEADTGDTPANYRFAGVFGQGPAHVVPDGLAATDAAAPHLQQAAGAADTMAFVANWAGVHPIHYHAKDYDLPQPGKTPAGPAETPIPFAHLATYQYLDRPEPVVIKVDHRLDKVNYFPNKSYLDFLDDGGVVIGDGFGAELRMVGGQVFITAPGDVWLKSGRNVNTWAGDDAVVRAKGSIDLSATNNDVRIKAKHHVQVLAGNDGVAGAVLIESRAPTSYDYSAPGEDAAAGGIHLKARGQVAAWAAGVYLRTGGGGLPAGPIVLDAGRGTGTITSYSDGFTRYLATSAVDYFGTESGVTAANLYAADSTRLGSGLVCNGPLNVLSGGAIVNGDVGIAAGHISTERAAQYQYKVGAFEGAQAGEVRRGVDDGVAEAQAEVSSGTAAASAFAAYWYGPGAAGADATIKNAAFCWRTAKQCGTDQGFRLYEDRWQQAARLGGGAPAVWLEDSVVAPDPAADPSYPYPGKGPWVDDNGLVLQDLALFDPATGSAKDRDPSLYGTAKFKTPTPTPLDGHYGVIR